MKKQPAKKPSKSMQRKEMGIEKAENRIAKSLPAGKRKEFSQVQKREAKLEKRE